MLNIVRLVETLLYLLNTHSTFVDQQLHILARSWNGRRGNIACCRFVLWALSSLKRQGNSQLMKRRNHGDSRQQGKLSPELAEIYSLALPSFAAISTRALSIMSRFLWSFDLTSYRHGKVSYRLISWLVLSNLQSNSAVFNSSAAMLIIPRNHVTSNSKLENDWLKPFNRRQLVERNKTMLYFRSTTFQNFQHVERHMARFKIFYYIIHWSTFVEQQLQHFLLLLNKCWTVYHSLIKDRVGTMVLKLSFTTKEKS